MARKDLINEVKQINEQLKLERGLLKLEGMQRMAFLRRQSPLWILGGGLAVGLLAGLSSGAGRKSLLAFSIEGLRLWRIATMWMPSSSSALEGDA
ncbi:hypothetical protein HG264_10260 [Pseudomonas sp. gcc21]|uniref:hypothetical protein n=1 Tax=Pseudomonas sp. gcc21 TaxID=2726989 RepID=UPI0014520EED|nr:hypothetical protein [Pseudomonas sp. gcc21]QJD59259.1 hypothetical protein HG264_10260 [Pseudomonas sp. gcc21]